MAAYKDEVHNTWMARFYYTDWQGVRRQKKKRGFEKKKDALAYEADFIAKSMQRPDLSLEALSKDFLKDYKARRSPNSYKLAETNVRLHILPELGKMIVSDITPLTIRTWQNKESKRCKSPNTFNAINITFQSLMKYAVRFYNLEYSPFDKVEPISPEYVEKEFLEHTEWLKLYSTMTNKHDRAAFSLLYWSGMRVGELQGLSLNDINFDTETININKQYSDNRKEIAPLKTRGSNRIISIPSLCMDVVKEYIEAYIEPPMFPFTIKTPKGLNTRLKKYCRLAGVKTITAHALRHSHASLLIKQGIAINLIAERLGHASPTTTLRVYSHVYENQDHELAGMLNNMDVAKA